PPGPGRRRRPGRPLCRRPERLLCGETRAGKRVNPGRSTPPAGELMVDYPEKWLPPLPSVCRMNKLLATLVVVLLPAASVSAQSLARTYPRPCTPPQEVLDRINLKMDWRVYIPMDGVRDGFLSIQLLGDQILVQTRSGGVALLDAATGATIWRA